MRRLNSVTLAGSRVVHRTGEIGVGLLIWVLWSGVLYWLLSQFDSPIATLLAAVLVSWNALLLYLTVRSLWVRISLESSRVIVHGWFRRRVFERDDIERFDQVRGPVPLAVAVSFAMRTVPQSWFLVITTRTRGPIAVEASIASYRNSQRQLKALRFWQMHPDLLVGSAPPPR